MTDDELQELEQLATFDGGELVTTSQIKLATAVLKLATEVRRLKAEDAKVRELVSSHIDWMIEWERESRGKE